MEEHMGTYVYKVTAKTARLSNGELANVSAFAYKPSRNDEKSNARMHFRSGCVANDAAADNGKRSCWVLHANETLLRFPHPVGSYSDDYAVEKYAVKL
jgi:hypothetical protein